MTSSTDNYDFSSGSPSRFNDPFVLYSSWDMPSELRSALDYCRFLYFLEPAYRQATKRVVGHFVTGVKCTGDVGDTQEQRDFVEYLEDDLDLLGCEMEMGEEWGAFGNSFWRIHQPFNRWLIDMRRGYREWSVAMFPQELVSYNWSKLTYRVPDPMEMRKGTAAANCKKIDLSFIDRKSTDRSRIKLKKIDPRRVILWHSYISGAEQVIYRFEEQFVQQIKDNKLWQVNETPLPMLEAIAKSQDFLFAPNEVFHFKAPTISGISLSGWGLPETMANYRALHQLMVYRKIDEAVGLDYILPWRVLAPNLGDRMGDYGNTTNMLLWRQSLERLVKEARKNPFAVHTMPFPIHVQSANSPEGKALVQKDLIEFQQNSMLDSMGYPVELFKGSLQIQQVPTAVRLFQSTFRFIPAQFNRFAKWVSSSIQDYLGQERMQIRQLLPSVADDLEKRNIYLQLAGGGTLSMDTAYRPLGIDDPLGEVKKKMQEDAAIQRMQKEVAAETERQLQFGSMGDVITAEQQATGGQSGSFPGGAAGAPGGGQGGMTPMQMQNDAQQMAQQWAQTADQSTRTKLMRQAEATSFDTYAIAKQIWEDMKSEGESQGRAAVTSGQSVQQ
jgi:hypothetical protein